jgi:integrase
MPLGSYGTISVTHEGPSNYRARARFRDADGITRSVVRFGQTKRDATDRLKAALVERQTAVQASTVQAASTVSILADLYFNEHRNSWATNTRDTYRYVIKNQIKPALGSVLLRELRPGVVARAITRVRDDAGPGAAKTMKTVLAGMFDYAVAQDAMTANPARVKVNIPRGRKTVRALTKEETDDLCDKLRADEVAVADDLPDLVEWMLGTGARIGEACAARFATNQDGKPILDLEHGTWEINATLIRVLGVKRLQVLEGKDALTWEEEEELQALRTLPPGLHIQPRTKTDAGWRVLALPPFCVEIIKRRQGERRLADELGVLFGSPKAKALRDPRNTARDLRAALNRHGFEWVRSHTFRKTVATRLDEAGLTPREVADHLGHAKPSMTLDVYMGRDVVTAAAAQALER